MKKLLAKLATSRPHRLMRALRALLEKPDHPEAQAANLAALLRGKCPLCAGTLAHHEYALFAAITFPSPAATTLVQALEREDWDTCRRHLELTIEGDFLDVFLLRCATGRTAYLLRKVPFEYFLRQELLAVAELSSNGRSRLETLTLNLSWQPFPVVEL